MVITEETLIKQGYRKEEYGYRDTYYGTYFSFRTLNFPNFTITFGKHKGETLKEAIDKDNDYWVWFAYHVDMNTPEKRNILRYMCCLANDLSCTYNAEAGFLREHRKFIEENDYEYEEM